MSRYIEAERKLGKKGTFLLEEKISLGAVRLYVELVVPCRHHFKWVNYMVCKLYLNKAVLKNMLKISYYYHVKRELE